MALLLKKPVNLVLFFISLFKRVRVHLLSFILTEMCEPHQKKKRKRHGLIIHLKKKTKQKRLIKVPFFGLRVHFSLKINLTRSTVT